MTRIKRAMLFSGILAVMTGCTTSGTFVIPEDTELYINKRAEPVTVGENGKVVTKPYFWSSIGGVPYRLEKDGNVVKSGKLRAKFRPVSIFWPPYALIYWPAGLNPNITYDLINDTQE